jgi:hypothetical protein
VGAAMVAVVLTLAGAGLSALANVRRALPPRIPWIVMIALIATYVGLILYVLPALEQRKVVPDMARWVAARAEPADRIASFRLNRWTPTFRFYVGRHTTFLETPEEADAFFKDPRKFYCLMRRSAFDEFVARGIPLRVLYEREGMGATSGRALWRTYTPLVRFVVVSGAR